MIKSYDGHEELTNNKINRTLSQNKDYATPVGSNMGNYQD